MTGTWPSIDHGALSPSGRISKRARAAFDKRETARLFPPGYWDVTSVPETWPERRKALLWAAANLRSLAAGGMGPRKNLKAAIRIEGDVVLEEQWCGCFAGDSPKGDG